MQFPNTERKTEKLRGAILDDNERRKKYKVLFYDIFNFILVEKQTMMLYSSRGKRYDWTIYALVYV